MTFLRIAVLGGYGFFGQRLVRRLAGWEGCAVLVAGRSQASAAALVAGLRGTASAALEAVALDLDAAGFGATLAALRVDVLVHTAGPFQGQDYRVARACIAAGVHYIDLADGRDFVAGICALDGPARHAGVAVVAGASSVPALSGAAVDRLARGMRTVRRIDIGISPGNRTERGLSTVRGILGYCGRPIGPDGAHGHGWCGRWRHRYAAPVGTRLLSPCDVPDLALLPARYPGAPAIRFGAGLELPLLHRGMNLMAAVARRGWVRDWSAHAGWLKAASDLFRHLGSDAGAMHVEVEGLADDGGAVLRRWELQALGGDGPYVPTLAAAALLRRLRGADSLPAGAQPCVGLLDIDDIAAEARGLAITFEELSA